MSFIAFADNNVLSLDCKFTKYSDSTGFHKKSGLDPLKVTIDLNTNEGFIEGNVGLSKVVVIPNELAGSLSFIETTDVGNVNVTTISNTLNVVSSRNTVLFNTMMPSQHYGICK